MKKNTIIILDATKAQVTKAFAKQARIFGTPEYREWRAFLAENPGITERGIQKQLHIVCDYLGFEGISTHSFRKWYATEIYKANGYDIALVQRLLQHSSAAVTQRYIGIEPQRIEAAIEKHAYII